VKQEVLALLGCIAATTSSTSVADVLPEKLVGLNLGEIRASSFLNQPFKGVIPFLFTSYENSKTLSVGLAPQSVFNKVGAEMHPILNNLNFQVTHQNNKPVILISSNQPISLPFLNFILEIRGPDSVVYQDYTVLLDPESKQQAIASNVEYIDTNQSKQNKKTSSPDTINLQDSDALLRESGAILLANLSSKTSTSTGQKLRYRVKAGDSLSKIAQQQNRQNTSLKKVSGLIFQKNPNAFIRGNVNRLKKGVILNLPTQSEIEGFEIAKKEPAKKHEKITTAKAKLEDKAEAVKTTYTVLKGDSLSKISKKLASKDIPFTNMMNKLYDNNPAAFINNDKNRIKAGSKLNITFPENELLATKKSSVKTPETKVATKDKIKPDVAQNNNSIPKPKINHEPALKPNQYRVNIGDTLSSITKKLSYQDVPFAKMLKAIYANNPDAFENGKMSKLIAGSLITLPPINSIDISPSIVVSEKSFKAKKPEKVENVEIKTPEVVKTNDVAPSNLTKRIRELRKELSQARENLADLKNNLSSKETLLEQKNIQLNSLNTLLTKLENSSETKALAASAIKTKIKTPPVLDTVAVPITEKDKTYRPKSKAEMAKLQREQLNRKSKTKEQVKKIEKLQKQISSPIKPTIFDKNSNFFKDYTVSAVLNLTNSNYAYLTMALFLSLLLIRYRRELYSYTYSKINYDEPKYYPLPDADTFDLTERNINFNDSKLDEQSNYDSLTSEEEKVTISPHLVEATEEIFEASEEEIQIEHCEHLVTELFDDLSDNKSIVEEGDWENIEKVCDTYIDKIRDGHVIAEAQKNGSLVNDVTDFNDMMSDLLESLDKVDKSVKKNNDGAENNHDHT